MRYSHLFLPVACIAASAPMAFAQAAPDSSEVFLDAYMNVQQAEKLENAGNYRAALSKYRYAGSLLDQLNQRDPEWQKLIVAFRRKKTAEAIAKLEKWIALEEPAAQTPVVPGGSDPNALPRRGGGGPADLIDQAAQEIRRQMEGLQTQLRNAQVQLENARHEQAKTRAQLEAAVAQLEAQGSGTPVEPGSEADEIRKLRAELAQARASAREAQSQLARARTAEGTLEDQLSAAEISTDPDAAAQIAALRRALDDARADREVAEEQNELMTRRLKEVSGGAGASEEIRKAQARAKEMEAANEAIARQLADAQVQIEALETSGKKMTEERDEALAREKELVAKLGGVEKALEGKTAELTEAEQKLVAAAKEKAELTEELTAATKGKEELEKLVADNRTLIQQLEESRAKADPAKEKEIQELQTKIADVEGKLLNAEAENEKHRAALTDLEEKLKTATAAEGTGDDKKLAEENELLRGIILRDREEQTKRDKARKTIMEELGRLQVRSHAINEQVELLSSPVQPLTEQERALFKGPQLEIVDNQSNALSISIIAPQVSGGDAGADAAPDSGVVKTSTARLSEDALKRIDLPEPLRDLAREGRAKFDDGDFNGAERSFEALVAKAPDNVFALTNLATARYRNGKLPEAVETFQKVVKIAPNDAFSHATLGIIYYKQNQYDAAVESLTRSLAINPKNATAHNYLGVAAAQKGWKDAAKKYIGTAIQINPDYADAHFNLAVVLATAEPPDKENARKHYKKAIALGAEPDKALEELIR